MGKKGLCGKYIMPIMRKQQHRFQATVPSPMVKGRWACPPIGASDMKPASGHTYPVVGEDMGYLVRIKRNCFILCTIGLARPRPWRPPPHVAEPAASPVCRTG